MKWHYVVREEYRELGLTGFSLIIYSIIAGYSQNGRGCYYGGNAALAEMAGCKTDTARKIVTRLAKDGFVDCERLTTKTGTVNGLRALMPEGCGIKCRRGAALNAANSEATPIIDESKDSSYLDNKKEISTLARARVRESFTKPTLEEVREYCDTRANDVDPEQFFDHYESNGWMVGKAPMKDWRAAVRNWERRDLRDRPARKENRPARKESSFERSLREFDRMYGTNFMEDEGHGKD